MFSQKNEQQYNLPGSDNKYDKKRKTNESNFSFKWSALILVFLFGLAYYFGAFNSLTTTTQPAGPLKNKNSGESVSLAEKSKLKLSIDKVKPEELKDVEAIKEYVAKVVDHFKVVVFSKSYCPHSKKAKTALLALEPKDIKIIELDTLSNGAKIQEYLKEFTGRGTVPNIFINQKNVGGNDDLQELIDDGKVNELLEKK